MNAALPLAALLEFALDATWQAGRITLGHFQTAVAVERKGDQSPVTIADRQSEQQLRSLIAQYWPEYGIIGEEYGAQTGASPLTWVIDPIDGTKSFIHGVPFYAVLLALLDGDESLVGVAHFPALNETVYAARGLGCWWNGRRARVSSVGALKDAALLASDLDNFAGKGKAAAWQRLIDATLIQRTWGDAYGYALVATGRAEIMVDAYMELWDCAPLAVILNEAGGTFTDWRGTTTVHGGESIATNGLLFNAVMELVNQR
ncbi:MAG: histidinol phosphate phosphatase [Chloroflexi bacterium]|nr:histidinol phosphate phosphatase [Chloroflexota bacterium]